VLQAREIEHFLPLVRHVRYYGRRKQVVQLPLFQGYLFLRGVLDDAYVADRTDRVAQVLEVADQAALEADLAAIRLVIERDGGLRPAPYLSAGEWVEVTAGPFRGVRGVVDRNAPCDRLVLRVRALGRAADLEIDRSLLARVG
jgi:transcription antitermination factor NusG